MQITPSQVSGRTARQVVVRPVLGESPLRAREAAAQLALPYHPVSRSDDIELVVGETSAWLETAGLKVAIRFDSAAMLHRRHGGQNELLGRAVGVKNDRHPVVFDATGGLGRDAFVLADLGCRVTLCEQTPALAWLLQDAILCAQVSRYDAVRDAVERMTVCSGQSEAQSLHAATVIYIDPMFPERKKAAAVKKEAMMLQYLSASHDGGESLMAWAWQQAIDRIVVKRPLKAPVLGERKASFTLSGKSVRFDVFVRNAHSTSVQQ
ncbi:class I SAM-dependent methyltransferase [Luminiphilus sp.]|nr:class I SAM-dependent methyltransferase [Luminiphilus sp.]